MKDSFLYKVAENIYGRFGKALHDIAVVFPNKRQAYYFQHYLQQIAEPPCFLPGTFSIEGLVALSTDRHVADNLTQGFALYQAYRENAIAAGDDANKIPEFDKFFPTGEILIKDFRDMDAYCTNVEQVCTLLYEIETIDKTFDQLTDEQRQYLKQFWTGAKDKSQIQQKFLTLWERLPDIYKRFHALLDQNNQTTLGYAYRSLATNEAIDAVYTNEWQHIAFVGFNALNKAEEIVLKRWQDKGFASFWFDTDGWYMDNSIQEAGDFLRKNMQQVGLINALPQKATIAERKAPIQVTGADGYQLQAKTVAPWLQSLAVQPGHNTGILLADESLLLPVLQSLPENAAQVNVTMGYPLQQSAVFDLIKLYLDTQADLQKRKNNAVHYDFVMRWLRHPLCTWPKKDVEKLQKDMLQQYMVHVPVALLYKHDEASGIMFSLLLYPLEVFDKLTRLCQIGLQNTLAATDDIVRGLLVAAHDKLQQLQFLFKQLKPMPGFSFIASTLVRQLGTVSVAFEGEPLAGLQIMGLLESRGIDFDHLIILGAGEGHLPRIKQPESFLPHNIRRAFGMTVPEHQDAIFAYVFYRLLQRSQTTTVVYNALISDSSTGEVSRFVQQLQFESSIPFTHNKISLPVTTHPQPPITITKTTAVMNKLYPWRSGKKPISPTGINAYISCRLKFYFQYVLGLKKPDELQEMVEANQVGSVVHELMEQLYKPYEGKIISADTIDELLEQAKTKVDGAFAAVWLEKSKQKHFVFTGELKVVREVALQFTAILLQADKANAPFTVRELEIKMEHPFTLPAPYHGTQIMLSGYADRVDEKDGVVRMVDYKTGADKPDFSGVANLFARDSTKGNKAALQTLLYSWLFYKNQKTIAQFEPALLIARQLTSSNGFAGHLYDKESKQQVAAHNVMHYLQQVEENLAEMFTELFESDTPFDQTTRIEHCQYCDFAGICGR